MSKVKVDELVIDGTTYVPKGLIKKVTGNRAVVVIDRGWIYAGDIEEHDGRIRIHNAIWVFRWEGVGLDGVLNNPKDSKVELRRLGYTVDVPADAEIYRVPVEEDWGA